MTLNRRRFLGLIGAALGALPLPIPPLDRSRPARQRTAPGLRRSRSAERIGRLYLEDRPGERDRATLCRALGLADGVPDDPSVTPWERLLEGMGRTELRHRIRDDFRAERTVRLRGWVLADTEVRLCALAALTSEAR